MLRKRKLERQLYRRLQLWQAKQLPAPAVAPEFAALQAPMIAQVTCKSPKQLAGFRAQFRILSRLVPLAMGVGIILHANVLYICGVGIAVRLFESIPYWFYRDRPRFPNVASQRSMREAHAASQGQYAEASDQPREELTPTTAR